ncbi:MAG: OmpA family protein [Bacteroidales bacterium]|nr:OmpA family protein [Bacteroidales bacterium]
MKNKVLLLLLLFVFNLHSQYTTKSKKAIKNFEKALQYYNIGNLLDAQKYAKQSIKIDSLFIEPYLLLADIYNEKKQYKEESIVIERILSLNPNFNTKLFYKAGMAYKNQYNFEKAIYYFTKFLETDTQHRSIHVEANNLLKKCKFADSLVKHPVPFNLYSLIPINSNFKEYWPSLTVDGNEFVFTRQLPSQHLNIDGSTAFQEDIFMSYYNKEKGFSTPIPLAIVNTPDNEGSSHLSANGKYLFYVACNRKEDYGSCDIYVSTRKGNTWSKGKNLGPPINSSYWESNPATSADGRILLFSSDRQPSLGGKDIFIAFQKDDGSWTEPVNIGNSINTQGNEYAPYLHPDGKTLYFSSDGWPGIGGQDIFVSFLNDDSCWTTPLNLGYPINTPFDDFGLIVASDGKTAYLSSNRENKNDWNIYTFELYPQIRPSPVNYIKGNIVDAKTKKPIAATVTIYDIESNKLIYKTKTTYDDNSYLAILPFRKEYLMNVYSDGYIFYSDNFVVKDTSTINIPFIKNIELQPIEVGVTTILRNIFYESDKYELLPKSKKELEIVVNFLKKNPSLKVEIGGHTDNIGSYEYNLKLSEKRAFKVYEYLINNGIPEERVTYKGYSFSVPIATNDTENGRSQNRRTELKIISK